MAPLDLVPALRRIRARAHARRIPDVPPPPRSLPASEQLLHDLAAIGTRVAHGGIQLKGDGELYAKAARKLLDALGHELTTLVAAAHKQLEHHGMTPPGIGLAAVQMRAVSGGATIGLDSSGTP